MVVVLPGVYDLEGHVLAGMQLPHKRGQLDEIRSCAGNEVD